MVLVMISVIGNLCQQMEVLLDLIKLYQFMQIKIFRQYIFQVFIKLLQKMLLEQGKIYLTAVHGLGGDDVRLSKTKKFISEKIKRF